MVQVPIPEIKIVELKLYFIGAEIDANYKNYVMVININSSDRVADLRKKIEQIYGINQSGYVISWVKDNRVLNMYNC